MTEGPKQGISRRGILQDAITFLGAGIGLAELEKNTKKDHENHRAATPEELLKKIFAENQNWLYVDENERQFNIQDLDRNWANQSEKNISEMKPNEIIILRFIDKITGETKKITVKKEKDYFSIHSEIKPHTKPNKSNKDARA